VRGTVRLPPIFVSLPYSLFRSASLTLSVLVCSFAAVLAPQTLLALPPSIHPPHAYRLVRGLQKQVHMRLRTHLQIWRLATLGTVPDQLTASLVPMRSWCGKWMLSRLATRRLQDGFHIWRRTLLKAQLQSVANAYEGEVVGGRRSTMLRSLGTLLFGTVQRQTSLALRTWMVVVVEAKRLQALEHERLVRACRLLCNTGARTLRLVWHTWCSSIEHHASRAAHHARHKAASKQAARLRLAMGVLGKANAETRRLVGLEKESAVREIQQR
jgi:hypothetical protein